MMTEKWFLLLNKICELCTGEVESLVRKAPQQNSTSLFVIFVSPFAELSVSKKESFIFFFFPRSLDRLANLIACVVIVKKCRLLALETSYLRLLNYAYAENQVQYLKDIVAHYHKQTSKLRRISSRLQCKRLWVTKKTRASRIFLIVRVCGLYLCFRCKIYMA